MGPIPPFSRRRQPSSSPALEPEDWEAEVEKIFAKASLNTSGSGRRSLTVSADEVAVKGERGAVVWEEQRVVDDDGGSERELARPSSLFINLDDYDEP